MDELISKVTEKTSLPPEQAKSAAESVLDFLKARLPRAHRGQPDSASCQEQLPPRPQRDTGKRYLGAQTMFGKDKQRK